MFACLNYVYHLHTLSVLHLLISALLLCAREFAPGINKVYVMQCDGESLPGTEPRGTGFTRPSPATVAGRRSFALLVSGRH